MVGVARDRSVEHKISKTCSPPTEQTIRQICRRVSRVGSRPTLDSVLISFGRRCHRCRLWFLFNILFYISLCPSGMGDSLRFAAFEKVQQWEICQQIVGDTGAIWRKCKLAKS